MINQLKKLYFGTKIDGFELKEIQFVENKLEMTLPNELKKYLLEIGKAQFNNGTFFELLFPNIYIEGDFYIFYECCHFTFRWGIHKEDIQKKNPTIYEQNEFELNETPWEEITTLSEGLFLMALINGTFYGRLAYSNYAFVQKSNIKIILKNIDEEWSFYKEINEIKIYTKDFQDIILIDEQEEGFIISIGSNDEKLHKKCKNKLMLEWEIKTTTNKV